MNNMKRMRGRNHRGGGGGGGAPMRHQGGGIPMNRNHVFDSNGPDLRVRGTAQQLFEKYLQLGRDASGSGDRVMAEGYFQHAEHYFRIVNAMNQAAQQQQVQGGQQGGQQNGQQNGHYQQRRPYPGNDEASQTEAENEDLDRADRLEQRAPGIGDQPETREIPIAGAPPE